MTSQKDLPRTNVLTFKTDSSTLTTIQRAAKQAGVPVSKFLHDQIKSTVK